MFPSRYELKFLISTQQKARFLNATRSGLQEDSHGKNAVYRVTSQYLDSPQLENYWEKLDGVEIRKKIRIRFYGEVTNSNDLGNRAVFLEIKHRLNNIVAKERVRLTSSEANNILHESHLLGNLRDRINSKERWTRSITQSVERAVNVYHYLPVNVISYVREAWEGKVDDRLRVTFDSLCHAYEPDRFLSVSSTAGIPMNDSNIVVLEIKFNRSIPRWIRDIINQQGLIMQRFSKYATGLEVLHHHARRKTMAPNPSLC
ncbi:VTC domain-containing protein [Planctomycetota bacterium]